MGVGRQLAVLLLRHALGPRHLGQGLKAALRVLPRLLNHLLRLGRGNTP